MPDFKAKMHQILFRLGSTPDPAGGSDSASPDPLAGFKNPTPKERDERRGEGKAERRGRKKGVTGMKKERGKEGAGEGNLPPLKFRSGYATGCHGRVLA